MTCSKISMVVAEAVVVLRQLLQQNPDFDGAEAVVRRLAALLLRSFAEDSQGDDGRQTEHEQAAAGAAATAPAKASLTQPAARASIIWALSEYHLHITGISSDLLRVLAKAFPELDVEVKMQVGACGCADWVVDWLVGILRKDCACGVERRVCVCCIHV